MCDRATKTVRGTLKNPQKDACNVYEYLYNAAALANVTVSVVLSRAQEVSFSLSEACMLESKNPLELLANDPVELNILTLKARMMMAITQLIRERGLSQSDAANMLKVTQPRISNLMNGKISKFSIDMLIEMLGRLGYLMDMSLDLSSAENPLAVTIKKSTV